MLAMTMTLSHSTGVKAFKIALTALTSIQVILIMLQRQISLIFTN